VKTKIVDQKKDVQTRQALIDAGIQLVGEKGYDGASIGDIAAFTEVTKGAVYYYFGSKENFVFEIFRQRAEHNIALFRSLNEDNLSLADWIERSVSAIIGFSDASQQLFSLQVMMAALRPEHERIAALVAEIHAAWRNLIAQMVTNSEEYRNGQVLGDPQVIAVGIMALIDGLIIHFRLEPETFTKEAFIQRLAPLLKQWVLQPSSNN
jgi:AcrR family transcriptional regulator